MASFSTTQINTATNHRLCKRVTIGLIGTHKRHDFSITHNRDVIGGPQYFFELVTNQRHRTTFGLHNIAKHTEKMTTFFWCQHRSRFVKNQNLGITAQAFNYFNALPLTCSER